MRLPRIVVPALLLALGLGAAQAAPSPLLDAPLVGVRAEPVRIHVAQSAEAAQLRLQIQQLEEQIRLLTGQVEGLQFQLTQMQTLIERMTKDNEFRFQQLEGGGTGTSPTSLPGNTNMPTGGETLTTGSANLGAPLDEEPLGEPMHGDLGDSLDPLVGTDGLGTDTLGTLSSTRPLDLSLDGGGQVSNGDAKAQYAAGYDAIMRGDYGFAEDQFQQFVALYPDDPQAPDATNFLGDALMQRGAYDEAALVLAEGYQKYVNTVRAPDLMLKLGVALVGTGEVDVACRTFFTLEKRFPDLSPAFRQRLDAERSKAQCPL